MKSTGRNSRRIGSASARVWTARDSSAPIPSPSSSVTGYVGRMIGKGSLRIGQSLPNRRALTNLREIGKSDCTEPPGKPSNGLRLRGVRLVDISQERRQSHAGRFDPMFKSISDSRAFDSRFQARYPEYQTIPGPILSLYLEGTWKRTQSIPPLQNRGVARCAGRELGPPAWHAVARGGILRVSCIAALDSLSSFLRLSAPRADRLLAMR